MSGTSNLSRPAATAASSVSGAKDGPSTPEFLAMKEAVLAAPTPEQAALTSESLLKPQDTQQHERRASVSLVQQPAQQQPVHFVREKGQWNIARDTQLVNNLSWVVGFMELANAGDFAANVWNDIPVPVYAIVFMAIGGTVAGILSIFAFRDCRRACYNVRYLRKQRLLLLEEKRRRQARSEPNLEMDVILAINFREMGTETVTRWIMDLLMGCGAILICVGTYMAIGGANHHVWLASNLLSGYIGNAPIAVFGLFNASWAVFIFAKAQRHVCASELVLGPCRAAALVKRRARKVQVFSVINGTSTVLGGVGSMVTATQWWGYVILIPVIISSIFCNIWWRKMMGYTRSEGHPAINREELVPALEFAAAAEAASSRDPEAAAQWYSAVPETLVDMLDFLAQHSLFPRFCRDVMSNPDYCEALGGGDLADHTELAVSPHNIFALPAAWHPALMEIAKSIVRNVEADHFKNRERYLAELLGTYCAMVYRDKHAREAASSRHQEKTTVEEASSST